MHLPLFKTGHRVNVWCQLCLVIIFSFSVTSCGLIEDTTSRQKAARQVADRFLAKMKEGEINEISYFISERVKKNNRTKIIFGGWKGMEEYTGHVIDWSLNSVVITYNGPVILRYDMRCAKGNALVELQFIEEKGEVLIDGVLFYYG